MREELAERGARGPASRFLWPFFALKLCVALWALDRGFELGDEGYFLLNLHHPEAAPPPFEFYRLLGALGPVRPGVVGARALRLGLELGASLVLVAAVFSWARVRLATPGGLRFAPFLWLCALGTLLSAASRSFGYNDATNFCVYLAASGLIALAARPPRAARALRFAIAFGAGLATGLQLFVKFPPAIVLFGAASVALLALMLAHAAADRAAHFAAYLLGTVAGVAAVVVPTGGVAPLLDRLAVARQLPAVTGYDPLGLLTRSVALEIWTLVDFAVLVLAFGIALWRARSRGATADAAFARAFAIGAGVLLVVVVPLHPTFVSWTLVYLACMLVFLPIALGAFALARPGGAGRAGPIETFGLLLLLAALPFFEMLGTNVPLVTRLPSHALPLFTVIAVLLLDLRARTPLVRSERRVALALAVVTTLAFVEHHVRAPYGLPRPIWEQTQRSDALPGLRVDAASAAFFDRVLETMREAGYRRGDPILALDYMPGLVFLLGGVSPGSNLFMFDKPELNCFELNRVRLERPPWVILGEPMAREQQACLRTIAFPAQYRALHGIPNPYERVYAGFGRPGLSHALLFAPREAGARSP